MYGARLDGGQLRLGQGEQGCIDDVEIAAHLTPPAYKSYQARIREYETQAMPAEAQADMPGNELSIDQPLPREKIWKDRHDADIAQAVQALERESDQDSLRATLSNEFLACGLSLDSQEYQKALATLGKVKSVGASELRAKRSTYDHLMRLFARQHGVIADEVSQRRREAVVGAGYLIMSKEAPPDAPHPLFSLPQTHEVYRSWLRSKAELVDKLSLPDDETILDDYYRSADASFRRTLYGSRPMILDRGFESDSTDQIDAWQRRFYSDKTGYVIALTPAEWMNRRRSHDVKWLLYDDASELSRRLDELDASNAYSTRTYRKNNYRAEADRFTETITPGGAAVDEVDVEGGEAAKVSRLKPEQEQAITDVGLLVDANMPRTMKPDEWRRISTAIKDICRIVVSDLELPVYEYGFTSPKTMNKILARMAVYTHTDTPRTADRELCDHITTLKACHHATVEMY